MKIKGNFIWWFIGFFIIPSIFMYVRNEYWLKKNRPKPEDMSAFIDAVKPIKIPLLSVGGKFSSSIFHASSSRIGYKAYMSHIDHIVYQDSLSGKYFEIMLFDMDKKTYSLRSTLKEKKEIYISVHSDDLSNPSYGTKEKPIPAFSFKGVDEPIAVTSQSKEAVDGMKSLEPTPREFEHNVRSYLTYIMSKEEFNARFRKEKN